MGGRKSQSSTYQCNSPWITDVTHLSMKEFTRLGTIFVRKMTIKINVCCFMLRCSNQNYQYQLLIIIQNQVLLCSVLFCSARSRCSLLQEAFEESNKSSACFLHVTADVLIGSKHLFNHILRW